MASSVVQGQGAGFDENRFDGPVSENFKCTICFNVLNDPKSCRNNQHYFCSACIHQYVQNYSQTCPECRQELTVETLVTPPRILLNCISELCIKCDHVGRGCTDRIQLGELKNHLEECGFAPVTCANDGCDAVVNKRDRIHHETELCEFRRVQCHNCEELRNEMLILSEKQENLSKTTGQKLVKLEGKLDQVTTRLQNIEGNVNALNLAHNSGNTSVVQEITEIKSFMNDVLRKLSNINNVVCQMQASEKQRTQENDGEDAQIQFQSNNPTPEEYNRSGLHNPSNPAPRPAHFIFPLFTQCQQSSPAFEGTQYSLPSHKNIKIGSRVKVPLQPGFSVKTVAGIVKYIGPLPFKGAEIHVGIELDSAEGESNGSYHFTRFFVCRPNHGTFRPIDQVTPVHPNVFTQYTYPDLPIPLFEPSGASSKK